MMKEKVFDNGIQYSLHGDYYLPDLKLESEHRSIGRWGRMHRDYLKEHRPVLYTQLVLSGNLWTYLADINEQGQQRMEVLVTQMMAAESVTEELKEANQMEWIRRMCRIIIHAEKLLTAELIYI